MSEGSAKRKYEDFMAAFRTRVGPSGAAAFEVCEACGGEGTINIAREVGRDCGLDGPEVYAMLARAVFSKDIYLASGLRWSLHDE